MKQKNLVLMGIAVGCGLVAAILTSQMGKDKPVETVKMLVATKDMTTGTTFTKDNVEQFTEFKDFPKNAVNPEAKIIFDQKELIGKRLTRATHAGEYFNQADVNGKTTIMFEADKDIMSLPMNAAKAAAGFVGPGARVDIVGSVVEGQRREVFTLLADMHVLAVNGEQDLLKQTTFPDMNMVSFAVDEKQAKLIALANQRNCNLELLLRHPDAPKRYPTKKDQDTAYSKTLNLLKNLGSAEAGVQLDEKGNPVTKPVDPEKVTEMVDVYVANEDIDAWTEITKELLDTKFKKESRPKEAVKGAVSDFSPYFAPVPFKAFKHGVTQGQPALEAMIAPAKIKGEIGAKGPDSIIKDPPVGGVIIEDKPVAIAPWPREWVAPKPPEPRLRDIAQHSPRGTIVYRYQETGVETNEWKLIAILTPMEAGAKVEKKSD